MIYLVDGHNLIPKIPGLSLRAENDELQLIEVLQIFARVKRKKVEVYFDHAAQGQAGMRKFGTITAHFVHASGSADQAIRERLQKSARGKAQEYCVVSSDQAVRASARTYSAQTLTSEAFARDLMSAAQQSYRSAPPGERMISDEEVREWLELFNRSNGGKQE